MARPSKPGSAGCNVKFLENLRKERMTAIDGLCNSSRSLRKGSGIKVMDKSCNPATTNDQPTQTLPVPVLLVNSKHAEEKMTPTSAPHEKGYSLEDIVTAVVEKKMANSGVETETKSALIHLATWKMKAQASAQLNKSRSSASNDRRVSIQLLDIPSSPVPRRRSLDSCRSMSSDAHVRGRRNSLDPRCLIPNGIGESAISKGFSEIESYTKSTEQLPCKGVSAQSLDIWSASLINRGNKLPLLSQSNSPGPERHHRTNDKEKPLPSLLGLPIGGGRGRSTSPCATRRRLSLTLPVRSDRVPSNVEERLKTRSAHYKLQKYLEDTRSLFTTAQKLELHAETEDNRTADVINAQRYEMYAQPDY